LSRRRSFQFMALVFVTLILAQMTGPTENATAQSANSDKPVWGTLGGNSARNGSCLYGLERNRGEIEWTSFGYGLGVGASSPVIGLDGMIYVADGFSLSCISPEGQRIWMTQNGFDTTFHHPYPPNIFYSPSIAIDGSIYIGGGDVNRSSPWASLYAISPNGMTAWNYSCEDLVLCSPAISPSGVIYFGTVEMIGKGPHFLHALAPNGTSLWKLKISQMRALSSPAISPNGDIILVTMNESHPDASSLVAVSPQGHIKWSQRINASCESTPTISKSGDVLLGADDGIFYSFKNDGTLNWTFASKGPIIGGAAISPQGQLIFTSKDFRTNSSDNQHIYALKVNGSLEWTQSCLVTGNCYPLISRDGVVVAGGYAFNLDGTLRWKADQMIGSSAAAKDGSIYAGSFQGSLVAIYVEKSSIGLIVVASTTLALVTMALVVSHFERKRRV